LFSKKSYIWDVNNSNNPDVELRPPSLITCLRFNPKNTDILVGGSYNGLITCYDLRKPGGACGNCCLPLETSAIEKSHHDPVSDCFWVSSKTGHQCASVSTDGQMLWWDTRKLNEPIDSVTLAADAKAGGNSLGGCSLEYNQEAGPAKFLVGTEQGTVISINLRNRKVNNGILHYDNGPGKHHGPIYAIHRNPAHNKFFLTVGDWTTRIWVEDLKTPIITTKYHASYLTSGCWSPTRPGVFFVTRMDGVVDVWDLFHRQDEIAYSYKVGNQALSTIRVKGGSSQGAGGKLVAVGDIEGTVSLLELCDSLTLQQVNEKAAISSMLEREMKREKNNDVRERDFRRAISETDAKAKQGRSSLEKENDMSEEEIRKIDLDFFSAVKMDGGSLESEELTLF
jgi:dynein intermediate chain 2